MYLLFLDESGNSPKDKNFILAGLAVFEGEIYTLRSGLDGIMQQFFPSHPDTIFHASKLFSRAASRTDSNFNRTAYYELMAQVTELIIGRHRAISPHPGVVLFGQVIERKALPSNHDPYVEAFEGIVARFHHFLRHLHSQGNTQKGLIVLASSKRQAHHSLRQAFASFREKGTRLGYVSNIPLIPLFTEAKHTRLLQLADFVAYALYRAYEYDDWRYIRPLIPAFFQKNSVYEGLYHRSSSHQTCPCPACVSRRARGAQ